MKRFAVFINLLMLITCPALAMEGKVVHVYDGDTVAFETPGKQHIRIRLYGIDCPEYSQTYGQKAKAFTSQLLLGETVDFEQLDTDKNDRAVGLIRRQGTIVNKELLENGLAWYFEWFCRESFCSSWKQLEARTRQNRIGLWAEPNPISPWTYRKSHPRAKPQARQGGIHGNITSKIYHRPTCKHYNCTHCTESFPSPSEAQAAGYRPCRYCNDL